MKSVIKFIHLLGIILFLGSIFTFILVSALVQDKPLSDLAFGRQVIAAGMKMLTLPALWIIVLSGILLGKGKWQGKYFQVKLALGLVILLNAHFVIADAVLHASRLAAGASVTGVLSPDYLLAYTKESVMGAVNVLLALFAMGYALRTKGQTELT